MLAAWRGFLISGGWDPYLCKMCVPFSDPALVVPSDGTSWPEFGSDPVDDWRGKEISYSCSISNSKCSLFVSTMLAAWREFLISGGWTYPCAKCVSPMLTWPLWFPVMGLAYQMLEFNPVEDWRDKCNFGQKHHPILPIFKKVKIQLMYVRLKWLPWWVHFVFLLVNFLFYVWDLISVKQVKPEEGCSLLVQW